MIKKTNVKILGKDYEVSFPTVGQLQDIEAMKLMMTNNKYTEMVIGGLTTNLFALDSADAIAYMSVMVPELKEDLKVRNWRELDALTAKKLIQDFKEFMKWLKPLLDDLYNYDISEDGEQQEETE